MRFKVILAMVNEKYQDTVIESAKTAGATGVTILNARGEGLHFLVEDFIANIMETIYKAGHLDERGNGIAFSLDVDRAIGLESQMPTMEKDAKDHYF